LITPCTFVLKKMHNNVNKGQNSMKNLPSRGLKVLVFNNTFTLLS